MADISGFASGRLLVVAFEGWNDAGEAASNAVRTLEEQLERPGPPRDLDADLVHNARREALDQLVFGERDALGPQYARGVPEPLPDERESLFMGPGAAVRFD